MLFRSLGPAGKGLPVQASPCHESPTLRAARLAFRVTRLTSGCQCLRAFNLKTVTNRSCKDLFVVLPVEP